MRSAPGALSDPFGPVFKPQAGHHGAVLLLNPRKPCDGVGAGLCLHE